MSKNAYLFPGQGAQYPGMGKDFAASFSSAREIFEEADELLNAHISQIIFEGPEDLLTETRYSQIGIFVTSAAILKTIQSQFPKLSPSVCSGLSLGEYTALYASGRLGFADTLKLVNERARLMNEACEKHPGTMAAVLGLEEAKALEAIRGIEGVWIANYNSPGQIVISGTKDGVERAFGPLKEAGAKRVIPLSVHGAFHSGLMLSAQKGLDPFIQQAPIKKSDIDFVMNVPGNFVHSIEEIRLNLIAQVTHSVRWDQGIRSMEGIELFLEIGCGKTLAGLNRKIGVSAPTLSIEKVEDLEKIGGSFMQQLLKGKTAIVTGGTAGIGKAIATLFAEQGAHVAIFGTNLERGAQSVLDIEAGRVHPDQKVCFFALDVSKTKEVDDTIAKLLADWGKIDILVNNAGITRDNLLMKMSEEDWDRVIEVNLKSIYNTCKALCRPMMKSRAGSIINITSVIGLMGNAGQINYAASKSGMIGFTKSLAKELASRGIRANCIAPGYIETPMTDVLTPQIKEQIVTKIPLSRIGQPKDIANAALYLASDLSSYVTGQVIAVDGGMVM